MVTVKLYVEGGGDSSSLHSKCREGFRKFLENGGLKGHLPRIVACGGRHHAYDQFKTAIENGNTAFLLIDSENTVEENSPWSFLAKSVDKFPRPIEALDDHCHLMVVCMEAWFLADKKTLAAYFGSDFNEKSLPKNIQIEKISKESLLDGLKQATSKCRKGPYDKGCHSFNLLAEIDPQKVIEQCPWCRRFFEALKTVMSK